jgi:hypothetical protein
MRGQSRFRLTAPLQGALALRLIARFAFSAIPAPAMALYGTGIEDAHCSL